MMIVMHADATQEQISSVVARVEESGLQVHLSRGAERTVIGVVGDSRKIQPENYMHLAGIEQIMRITRPYKIASREFIPEDTKVEFGGQSWLRLPFG